MLELGSGTGSLIVGLAASRPDLEFIGIEPLAGYVDFARRRAEAAKIANVRFCEGVAEEAAATLDGARADYVISSDVLHHVGDQSLVTAQARAASAGKGGWLLIEPNLWNPYILAFQGLAPGERNFRPRSFLSVANANGWRLRRRGFLFLVPGFVASPGPRLRRAEHRWEHLRLLAGGVWLELEPTGPNS